MKNPPLSPVIITFKQYPELGRLKLARKRAANCRGCQLVDVDCHSLDNNKNVDCISGQYMYKKAD